MLHRAKRIRSLVCRATVGASNAPGDADVLTEWLEMRTQDTFLGFWNENQEFSSVDRRKPAAIANPKIHPGIPRCGACNRQKKKGIFVKAQVQPNQACGSPCRYTDGCVFIIARFSNTSDFLLQKKYGCSRAGRYPVEGISHEEDGSSDAGNSGTSKRCVNLFLC